MYNKINKKNFAKYTFLFLSLIFLLFLFTGCANVTYYVLPNSDSYTEGVKISLSKQDAIKYGYDINKLTNDVEYILQYEKNEDNNTFLEQLYNCYTKGVITADEYLFLQTVTPFKFVTDAQETEDSIDLYIELSISPAQNANMSFSILEIINIYKYADLVAPDDEEANNKDTSFIKDSVIAYLTGYTQNCVFNNEVINSYADLILNNLNYASFGLTKNDCSYSYEYATTSRRLHSNADRIVYNNGYYIHIWNYEQDENGNIIAQPMEFYYTNLNSKIWYFIGIGVAVVCGIIITIVLYIKHKTKIKNKITVPQEEIIIE